MIVFPVDLTRSSALSWELARVVNSNVILASVLTQLNDAGAEYLISWDSIDRVCGDTTFRASTVSLFLSESTGINVPRVAFLRPDFRPFMIVFSTTSDDGLPCTYASRAVGATGNDGSPASTPCPVTVVGVATPSPVPENTLDTDNDGIFNVNG